jgi:hypothetical protein
LTAARPTFPLPPVTMIISYSTMPACLGDVPIFQPQVASLQLGDSKICESRSLN